MDRTAGSSSSASARTSWVTEWSILPLSDPDAIWLEVKYSDGSVEVSYALDGRSFTMMRQAYLGKAEAVQTGLMIAAPTGGGFEAVFEGFQATPL